MEIGAPFINEVLKEGGAFTWGRFAKEEREKSDYDVLAKIDSIILFGSVARGEAKEDSDIDILVIWKGDEAEGWRAMTGLAFDVLLDEGEYISVKVLRIRGFKSKKAVYKKCDEGGRKDCIKDT